MSTFAAPRPLDPERLASHMERLTRVARHLTGRHGDAEDLVQDTFERVLRRPRTVTGSEAAYLVQAVRNTHLSRLRAAASRVRTTALPEDFEPVDIGAEDRPMSARRAREVLDAVAALPKGFREAVVLVDVTATARARPRASSASPRARCTAVCTGAARRSPARARREAMPGQMTLADGARLRVRPIVPADREPLADAFGRLSDRSRRQRFLAPKPRLSARELDYLTDVDHVTHEALVAIDETTGDIVGVGRYATGSGGGAAADMALVVADAWQRRGIGHGLARAPRRARPRERHHAPDRDRAGGQPARALAARPARLPRALGRRRRRSRSSSTFPRRAAAAPALPRRRPGRRAARRASSGRAWRTRASGDPRPCAW